MDKYIIFSMGWDGLPLAYKLKCEGCEVVVGQVQSKKELGMEDDERPEDRELRLKQYEGMMSIFPARKLVDTLKKVENKDEYFIFFDQNNLFLYAEELLEAGFTNGLFPTKEDFEFEKDRSAAMDFVRNNYPDIKIISHEEFETVAEAVAFLRGSDKVYVIQSKGDFVPTMVPNTDDISKEKDQMINHLEKNKEDFSRGGIILKDKLIHPVEITPQIVFYNGKVVFTDLDLETKNIGDGENNGNQVGCGSNLIIKTDINDKINDIAFPVTVHEMAKDRKGMFVWDISIYLTDMGMYFGEFCANRCGYDAVMTEMDMAGGAQKYFEAIAKGENPLKKIFGTGIRLFNLTSAKDREIIYDKSIESHVWLYDIYNDDGKYLSVGSAWDLGVITGSGETISEAVNDVYTHSLKISFKEIYKKSKNDLLDVYPTSIVFRFNQINHNLIEAPDHFPDNPEFGFNIKLKDMETDMLRTSSKYERDVSDIKRQLEELLNGEED